MMIPWIPWVHSVLDCCTLCTDRAWYGFGAGTGKGRRESESGVGDGPNDDRDGWLGGWDRVHRGSRNDGDFILHGV